MRRFPIIWFVCCLMPWLFMLPASAQGGADMQEEEIESFPEPAPVSPPETLSRASTDLPRLPVSYEVSPPPPPEPVRTRRAAAQEPGAYLRDGFYLRLSLGGGLGMESMDSDQGEDSILSDTRIGAAAAFDFAMGGTLGKGFVLGGVLQTMYLGRQPRLGFPMPEGKVGNDHGATLASIGLLGDWYPDPSGGFHVQAALGGGTLRLADTANSEYAASGAVVSAGIGYEWWIAPESSVGILGRVDRAALTYRDDASNTDFQHIVLHLGLMATATYH